MDLDQPLIGSFTVRHMLALVILCVIVWLGLLSMGVFSMASLTREGGLQLGGGVYVGALGMQENLQTTAGKHLGKVSHAVGKKQLFPMGPLQQKKMSKMSAVGLLKSKMTSAFKPVKERVGNDPYDMLGATEGSGISSNLRTTHFYEQS